MRCHITFEKTALYMEELELLLSSRVAMESYDIKYLLKTMCDLADVHFPKRRLSRKQHKFFTYPWLTKGILISIKHQQKVFQKYITKNSAVAAQMCRKYRNILTRVKEREKANYYYSLFTNNRDPSRTWKNINKLLNKPTKSNTLPSQTDANGVAYTSPTDIYNEFNTHFAKVGKIFASTFSSISKTYKDYLGPRHATSNFLHPTDEYKVLEAINKLNNHKSPGVTDIPVKIIKQAKFIIANFLVKAFNHCIENGVYPDILKLAKVIPLHKGSSKQNLGNYRPISILSPLNKIFELLLHKRLLNFWNKHDLFSKHQFGFREHFSTGLAITQVFESLLNNKGINKSSCVIFLDLAKAFDSINHQIL